MTRLFRENRSANSCAVSELLERPELLKFRMGARVLLFSFDHFASVLLCSPACL